MIGGKEVPAEYKCPKCKGGNVARKTGLVAVVDTYPPVVPWKCGDCGEEFSGMEFWVLEE